MLILPRFVCSWVFYILTAILYIMYLFSGACKFGLLTQCKLITFRALAGFQIWLANKLAKQCLISQILTNSICTICCEIRQFKKPIALGDLATGYSEGPDFICWITKISTAVFEKLLLRWSDEHVPSCRHPNNTVNGYRYCYRYYPVNSCNRYWCLLHVRLRI